MIGMDKAARSRRAQLPFATPAAELFDDAWQAKNMHWHGHIDTRAKGSRPPPTRHELATRAPDIVLASPYDVAAWIDEQVARYTEDRTVMLIGNGPPQPVPINNLDDRRHDFILNADIAAQGDSLHVHVYNRNADIDLFAEAAHDDSCANKG